MTTLVIKSRNKSSLQLLFELAKKMGEKPVLADTAKEESQLENELMQAFKELKQFKDGKLKPKNLDELLNAL